MPEEGKAKKKFHELSASPLFTWALVKGMVKQFQSHIALPTQCTPAPGWGKKGRATESQETEMLSRFRNENADFSSQKDRSEGKVQTFGGS